jgi:hypothetical protein
MLKISLKGVPEAEFKVVLTWIRSPWAGETEGLGVVESGHIPEQPLGSP